MATQVHAEWACHEKGGGSTCQALMALAQEHNVDLLVVGSFGRKGEKMYVRAPLLCHSGGIMIVSSKVQY